MGSQKNKSLLKFSKKQEKNPFSFFPEEASLCLLSLLRLLRSGTRARARQRETDSKVSRLGKEFSLFFFWREVKEKSFGSRSKSSFIIARVVAQFRCFVFFFGCPLLACAFSPSSTTHPKSTKMACTKQQTRKSASGNGAFGREIRFGFTEFDFDFDFSYVFFFFFFFWPPPRSFCPDPVSLRRPCLSLRGPQTL